MARARSFKARAHRETAKREDARLRERLDRATDDTRAERSRAASKCSEAAARCDAARAVYRESRKERNDLRKLVKEYRLIHRAEIARVSGERKKAGATTRRAESDDEVRSNLPPELLPSFERMKRAIKASPRMSRTEAFLQWAHDHPSEVFADDEALLEQGARKQAKQKRRSAYHPIADASPPPEEDYFAQFATANPSGLVALGWLSRLELVGGREVRVPRGTLLAYDPSRKRGGLAIVFGVRTSRARAPDGAAKEYARTHWGQSGAWGISTGDMPVPKKGTPSTGIARVVYTTKKGGDRALTDYDHPFEKELPRYVKCGASTFQILGGSYRVTEHGIVG
jgi:hypothetical protein